MHDFLHHVVLPILAYLDPSYAPIPSPTVTHALSTSPVPNTSITSSIPTNPPQPQPPDNTVKVAIVTALGLVLATAITAIASTFRRDASARQSPPPPAPVPNDAITQQYIAGLEHDRKELQKLRVIYTYLRDACFHRGLDPDDLIAEEEQRP